MSHRPTKLMAVSTKLGADTVAAAGQGVTDLRQRKSEWGANIPLRGLQPISGVKTDSGCESRADLTGLPLQMFVVTLTSLLVMLKSVCVDRLEM